ncbi:haloacid dehalogenase superfamily, subfamily IA, variant 3 with third motif having DD or ED [Faunimonas pinastri]|uniref:Haloacid dehalogenase superfamily, subfamily IA, variant 3 with third motif having DD or ED n=1 Tax=Faunimonas pinastri TaxID=1855383 RepID=A0A1H8ZPY6_9HYPH|nr:HAD family hydrolase [Faunimonas pinastri]SEP66482.1 haloacid dehalogenase superfamily, subfamily IA, variant 3 with third motif having DD or ED [Faunimonas pinastri]
MLIIFDCDGVLVDSEILAAKVDAEILTEIGYEISAVEVSHRFAGLTNEQIFKIIGVEMGIEIPEEKVREAERRVDARLDAELEPVAGVQEMLDMLDDPRCICSNSRSDRLRLSLTRTGLYDRFRPYIYSAREVAEGRPKPAPDVYLYGAAQFDSSPADTIVIEDSVHGVHGATTAGMRVIGFTGASHSWPGHADALTEAGAVTVINRLAELPATIEALKAWNPQAV